LGVHPEDGERNALFDEDMPAQDESPAEAYPLLSTRKNGDRLIGYKGPFGEDLYAAGTPPVWGLATHAPRAPRIANVRIGQQLKVQREGDHWVVSDGQGYLGALRWRPADERHPVKAVLSKYPARGTLHVQTLVINPHGRVVNFGGVVNPEPNAAATPASGVR
jgi:hypothetical protein